MSPAVGDPPQVLSLREQIAELQKKAAQVAGEEKQVKQELERERDPRARLALEKKLVQLEREAQQIAGQIASAQQQILNLGFEPLEDPQVDALDAALPLALLPVRLETRYAKGPSGARLLIRVYPDQIHQDSHEPELTDAEVQWGRHFWEQWWRAGGDADQESSAWAQLSGRFSPRRAAWVARELRPTNNAQRPAAPVADSDPLNPAPSFPSVARRASTWTRAPLARLLPDRFVAIGYRGGQRVFVHWGKQIVKDVAMGPSPKAHAINFHGLRIDDEMRWMLDFQRALAMGLALQIDHGDHIERGLDLLLVTGARSGKPTKSAGTLEDLLRAHQYSDGLGLVDPATPTNNSTSSTRSGYGARTSDTAAPFGWLGDDPSGAAPAAGSDGHNLVRALGVPGETLLDVEGAAAVASQRAGLMQAVLWPGCGGYALEQLFGGTLTAPERAALEQHMVRYVRPAGPLPTIRVGTQPYGVLPVAPPESLAQGAGAGLSKAVEVLDALRPFWLDSLSNVPQLPGADPDADLLAVLASDARSAAYAARPLMGPEYLDGLITLADPANQAADRADLQHRSAALLNLFHRLGLTASPAITRSFYAEDSALLRAPLIQKQPLSGTDPLVDEYLAWLFGATFPELLAGHDSKGKPFGGDERRPLLWLLARTAVLELLADEAFAVLLAEHPPAVTAADLDEPELVTPQVKTPLWRLHQSDPHTGRQLGDSLWPHPDPSLGPASARVKQYLQELKRLSSVPSAELDRLFRDTLDLHSHRLDAWVTSLATSRLDEMRTTHPSGAQVGAFGWVENLAPEGGLQTLPSRAPVKPKESAGWVHTPSLAHAGAAAVMRSGQLSHTGQGTGKLLGVNISSKRVREVDWLFDGMRGGQSLGAMMGYRFERALHDVTSPRLDGFLPALRAFAPEKAGKLLPAKQNGSARSVVDGMALLRNRASIPWGTGGLPAHGSSQQQAIDKLIDGLADLADAVSDVAVAESIYHAAQGNPLRAGGSLEALDRGEAPPPELEFAHPRRSGVGVSHRVGILRSASSPDPYAGKTSWAPATGTATSPRTIAEPVLSEICAHLLPPPGRVHWQARYDSSDPHTASLWRSFTLENLNVEPLDVVYTATPTSAAAAGELEARAMHAARAAEPGFQGEIELVLERDPRWGANVLTLPELAEVVAAIRALIVDGRALDARDLAGPLDSADPGVVMATLQNDRAEACATALDTAISAMGSASGAEDVAKALLGLAAFGIPGAVPESEDETALDAQATRVLALANDRKQAYDDLVTGLDPTATGAAAALVQAIQALLGQAFRVLPPFQAPQGLSFADSHALLGNTPHAVEDWIGRLARVREGMGRLAEVRLHSAVVQPLGRRGAAGDFAVAQYPQPDAGELWCALPTSDGNPPAGGRTSLVFEGAENVDLSAPVAGLFVDEWIEVVPNERETTAVAFGYDAPASCAPQSILLGVPPRQAKQWSVAAIEAIALEAHELAKVRMVDPDSLGELGHFLPALFFAHNLQQETITTDLPGATRS